MFEIKIKESSALIKDISNLKELSDVSSVTYNGELQMDNNNLESWRNI